METKSGENQPTAMEVESVEEKEEEEVDPNLWVVTDTTKYMEKQQSQGQDGAVSSWLPSPQQPAQPVKKHRKVPWTSYKPDGFGSFFDTTAEIQHKVFVILDLFPNDLDLESKTALDVAIDPDEHLRCRRSNREVIRRKFDDYTDHLSDYDSLVDEEESEEEEGEESEDEDYGAVKWTKKRKLADTTAPEDLPFKCPHCPRRFTRELYLKGHLVRHSDFKPYQCPHCEKTFGREHHLTSHMTHSHAPAVAFEGDEGEREEAIVFKCSLCGEGYPRVSQLTTHIQVAHAADLTPPAPPTDPPLGEGPATEGVYSSSSSDEEAALLIREDDDTPEAGTEGGEGGEGGGKSQAGPVFHCPYCPRTFSRQMYLSSHLFSHSEDRPHKCLLCGKGFSRVHHLKSHMTHRHPQAVITSTTLATTSTPAPAELTFKCPCCRRSFKKDFHLKSHIYQKHRENKDAFEFLKQFTNKKRKNSSDHSFGGSPATMETEDKSPSDNKPTVHNSSTSNTGSVSSEGGHLDFGKAQNVENGPFEHPRGNDPSNNSELHNSTSNATDLSPVFEESIVSSGIRTKVAASQPRAKENEDDRPYKCPTCGQGFARKSFLGSHIYQKHTRRRASSTDSEQGRQSAATGTAPKARLSTGEPPPATAKEDSTLVHIHPVKESSGRSRKVSSSTTISSDASDEDPSHDPLSSTPGNPSGIYKCPHCHRRFTRKAHLVSHVVAHSNERPYKCPHCEKAYGTGYHLKSHITYCHRSVVDTPPVNTPPVNTLPVDTPPADTPPADTPPVNTPPVNTLPVDTPPADTPPAASDRVFPFRCGECNESFPEHSMLRKHFQTHSKTVFNETKSDPGPHGPIGSTAHSLFSLPIEGNKCPPTPPPPPFPPPNEPGVVDSSSVSPHLEDGGDCGAWMEGEGATTTVVASGRIAPLESAALPSSTVDDDKPDGGGKGKPIKCPHCPRTFTYAGHLSSHLVSHSSQRPFACTQCSKSFAQRHHLKSHITHRHGNRQDGAAPLDGAALSGTQSNQPPPLSFSCVECGKAFAQKNHLASHVYHKHPHAHVRKSSSSSCREGGASGRVGRASDRVGVASGKVGGGTVQVGGTVVKLGVSPVREGGAPSPGLKSPRELLGFMQSVTSGNQLANLDVGGRSLMESPFMRGSPSTLNNDQQHLSTTREGLTLQGSSRGSPSARENPTMNEGLTGRGESGDRAEVKGSSSSKRRRLPVALGDHVSPDVSESPQTACLPGGTPPTKNMADPGATINSAHSVLPQQPVTFIGGIPIVQTSFPAGIGSVQKNSPVITGSSPGFYMLSAPPLSVTSHSVQQLSAQVTQRGSGETGFTGDGDVLFGTTQLRPSPSHPTSGAPPSLHCTHCPRIFHHRAHLDAHQAAHRTSSTVRTRSGSGLLAPLSHDCHMDSRPGTVGGAAPPLSTGYYMSPPHPVAVADDQSASVGYPIPQTKAPIGSRPRLPEPKEEGVFRCPYCPLSFDVKSHLASHLVSHENSTSSSPAEKPYQCPQCTESCDSSRQLNMHMKKTHQTAPMQVVEKEKLFKCDECGKSFQQEHHLGVHVYLKHLTDEVLGITEDGGAFPCAHCGRVFEYKHLLKSHMFHSHKGVGLKQPTSQSDLLANTTTVINTAA